MGKRDWEMALSVLNNLDISENTPHNLIGMAFAKEAVQKQIPKKPIGRDLWELGTATGHSCPTCGCDFPIGNYKQYKYCPDCGQAIS